MAIVETVEVRFQAELGALKQQISATIAKLNALDAVSQSVGAKVDRALQSYGRAAQIRLRAVQKDISVEGKYQAQLKKTAREAKGAGKAIGKAGKYIGLHRLDEVHLLDSGGKASSGGRGGGASGGGSGMEEAEERTLLFWKIARALGASMKDFALRAKGAFSGLAGGLERLLKGAPKLADRLLPDTNALSETLKGKIGVALRGGFEGAAAESTAPREAGERLAGNFSSGIAAKRATVAQAARGIGAAAVFSDQSVQAAAVRAGARLSEGFADGIVGKLETVKAGVSKIVNAAMAKIREKLKIHSPSKVTYAFGAYFAEGFASGMAASVKNVQHSAAALSAASVGALKTDSAALNLARREGGLGEQMLGAMHQALGDTQVVIPLNVDGMKLGEASIRGINRVTRAAGRVLLEI